MSANQIVEQYDLRIGFGRRLGAFLIDLMVNLIAGGIFGMILGAIFFGAQINEQYANGASGVNWAGIFGSFLGAFFGLFLGFFYLTILLGMIEGLTGWSIGKGILKIRIRHKSGGDANMLFLLFRCIIKYAPCFIWAIFFTTVFSDEGPMEGYAIIATFCTMLLLIALLFAFGKNKQTLYDMISQTAVYKKENR